jgi:pSer/pThr/pTyr-binding forkhead associated (FHA) protein
VDATSSSQQPEEVPSLEQDDAVDLSVHHSITRPLESRDLAELGRTPKPASVRKAERGKDSLHAKTTPSESSWETSETEAELDPFDGTAELDASALQMDPRPDRPKTGPVKRHGGTPSTAVQATPAPSSQRDISPFSLVQINEDGSDGPQHTLWVGNNTLGKGAVDIAFSGDAYLSQHHVTIEVSDDTIRIEDNHTLNGTYLRIKSPVRLEHNDLFRIGQELLRYQDLDYIEPRKTHGANDTDRLGSPVPKDAWARLVQQMAPERVGNAYLLQQKTVVLGRDRGDITFAKDGYVSGQHARLSLRDGQGHLEDMGSSNGTYIAIKSPRVLDEGDMVLIGQQLLRFTRAPQTA